MEVGFNTETVTGGTLGLTFLVFVARKFFVQWVGEKPQIAGSEAVTAQYKGLQESIEANRSEIAALRVEMQRMDRLVHVQQRTITRMEMLIRQFSGLVQEKGIDVPQFMQSELDDLLKADAERAQTETAQEKP